MNVAGMQIVRTRATTYLARRPSFEFLADVILPGIRCASKSDWVPADIVVDILWPDGLLETRIMGRGDRP